MPHPQPTVFSGRGAECSREGHIALGALAAAERMPGRHPSTHCADERIRVPGEGLLLDPAGHINDAFPRERDCQLEISAGSRNV